MTMCIDFWYRDEDKCIETKAFRATMYRDVHK